jgi:hypothetical protein
MMGQTKKWGPKPTRKDLATVRREARHQERTDRLAGDDETNANPTISLPDGSRRGRSTIATGGIIIAGAIDPKPKRKLTEEELARGLAKISELAQEHHAAEADDNEQCVICSKFLDAGGEGWGEICPSCADEVSERMDADKINRDAAIERVREIHVQDAADASDAEPSPISILRDAIGDLLNAPSLNTDELEMGDYRAIDAARAAILLVEAVK